MMATLRFISILRCVCCIFYYSGFRLPVAPGGPTFADREALLTVCSACCNIVEPERLGGENALGNREATAGISAEQTVRSGSSECSERAQAPGQQGSAP